MGVVSRRWVCLVGVVVRGYINFLILLIPTPLVSALFCSSIIIIYIYMSRTEARPDRYVTNEIRTVNSGLCNRIAFSQLVA